MSGQQAAETRDEPAGDLVLAHLRPALDAVGRHEVHRVHVPAHDAGKTPAAITLAAR